MNQENSNRLKVERLSSLLNANTLSKDIFAFQQDLYLTLLKRECVWSIYTPFFPLFFDQVLTVFIADILTW